ncbi:hypothetical protein P8452_19261 [Trifolium repens]|nr:hypothetical protein P8452_19261 [Trifolium repens]
MQVIGSSICFFVCSTQLIQILVCIFLTKISLVCSDTLREALRFNIMAELVAGAFLSSFFQVIFEKLASSNFTEYFHRGKLDKLVEELESTLDSINQVLDDAEIKQYQIPNVKKWLGDVKHAMYEADQLLDEIATDAPMKKLKAESQPSTSHNIVNFIPTFTNPFESRIKDLIKSLHSLVEQKDKLQLINQTHAGNAVGFNSKPSGIKETTCSVDASGIYDAAMANLKDKKVIISPPLQISPSL